MSNIEENIMSEEAFNELIDNFEVVETLTDYGRKAIKQNVKKLKTRIKELEEENRIQRRQLNSAFDRGWILKQKVKDKIKEAKYNKKVGNTAYEYTEEDVWDIVKDELEELLEDK